MSAHPESHSDAKASTLNILVSGGSPLQLPGFSESEVDAAALFAAYPEMKQVWMPSTGRFPYTRADGDGGVTVSIRF